jgi:alginate O-acetyltransferase complex protein AlgI
MPKFSFWIRRLTPVRHLLINQRISDNFRRPMLFNSLEFFILLAATFSVYYLPALNSFQVPILLTSSLVFYGRHQPALLCLLLLSILVNAISSYFVYYGKQPTRFSWAALGVVVNLSILIIFKYSKLIYGTFFSSSTPAGSISAFLISLPLPIGISFFTFQGISLVVDTYRMKRDGKKLFQIQRSFFTHLYTIAFFKSFFPQLVSGPIVKAREFLPQIKNKSFKDIRWEKIFRTLVLGYFLKTVVADQLKDQTFWITPSFFQNCSSLTLVILLFGYSIQIYADFAGYSLIAIGTAEMFGYSLPINFNFPYISRSFSEFWTRWHISLSSFLKQYLYIPLGGNRHGELRTYFNLFIVMFLGGLWHGATWSYAVWGIFHGILLGAERLIKQNSPSSVESGVLKLTRLLIIFSMVTFGWLLFKLRTLKTRFRF